MKGASRGPNFKTLWSMPFPGKTWVSNTKPSLLLDDPLIKQSKLLISAHFLQNTYGELGNTLTFSCRQRLVLKGLAQVVRVTKNK